MKGNSQSIDRTVFDHLSGATAGHIMQSQLRHVRVLLSGLRRNLLPAVLSTLAMAGILFTGITLFLYQLAEHGW